MKVQSNRVVHQTFVEKIIAQLHKYAYAETLFLVGSYLFIGYMIDEKNVCMVGKDIPYLIILLTIITLFHGFESGILAMSIIAFALWFFYPIFDYKAFLVPLMMTLIFSEFHYFWTRKIKAAELLSNYRETKLNELSRAFYSLKISHDQLEKNYVVKPMSIRNSIEYIIHENQKIESDMSDEIRDNIYYNSFLRLLKKSFNVSNALVLHRLDEAKDFDAQNGSVAKDDLVDAIAIEVLFKDYLIDKAINRKTPIYVSNEAGDPSYTADNNSLFMAAIPVIQENVVVAVLAIKSMPFMAFNRENLTSIAILLEYFAIEVRNQDVLRMSDRVSLLPSKTYRFEYARLSYLYNKFNVNSINLVLRVESELQATRLHEKIDKMLRALDMVTLVSQEKYYYIVLMFPLHDKAAAMGFLNRLLSYSLKDEKDKEFDYMTFDLSQTALLNSYLRDDYGR